MRRAWGLVLLAIQLLSARHAVADDIPSAERRSDTATLSPETRAMQADDAANPGMLSVLDGEALWAAMPGSGKPSCGGCHGDAATSMVGVAARYPAWSEATHGPIDLAGQIDLCRTARQSEPALERESRDLLALSSFVAHQSRGRPIAASRDARMSPVRQEGRRLFQVRMGQLNLSCAQCHDERWGRSLAGTAIPQGHPVGYPIYRLEWQQQGSLQRRLRNCMTGIRAEPFSYGSAEFIALETFLMSRAEGRAIETPAVRP